MVSRVAFIVGAGSLSFLLIYVVAWSFERGDYFAPLFLLGLIGLFSGLLRTRSALAEVMRALSESEEKFNAVAENAHAAFGIVQGTRFVYANKYFAELSGYTVDELLTMEFVQLVHPDFRELMLERAKRRQMGLPVPSHYEFVMIRRDGSSHWVDFSPAATIYRGKPAIIGTGFDITHRKEIEAALNDAKEAAEKANRVKDHFLAVLSHELRTPLTPVLAALSLLAREDGADKRKKEMIEIARRNVDLEVRLIDDLLDLTRIARGKIALDLKNIDIGTVISRAAEICQPDIEKRQVHLEMQLPETPYAIRADISRLQQVFWNILKNAVKFSPQGGVIRVRCVSGNRWVTVEVTDNGIGFDPSDSERLFNAFEQADQSTAHNFGGLGLGLAISKRLVEMHKGTICAFSDGKGRGATFCVSLPLIDAPQESIMQATSEDKPKGGPLRILLVEDNLDTAHLIELALKSAGHFVVSTGDVSTAVEAAGREDFDLLISDLGLPDRSGFDLIRELRVTGRPLKAIALSGFGRDEDIRKSLEAGFSEHVTKPVDLDTLESAVQRAT